MGIFLQYLGNPLAIFERSIDSEKTLIRKLDVLFRK